VRDAGDLARAFHQDATYLFDGGCAHGVDIASYSIECTKATLGLMLFLNLAWRGSDALGAYVERQYDTTRAFYETLRARDGFACPYEPESNILCFRYGDDDGLQDAIRRRLLESGEFHISATHIDGRRYLRVVVMAPATTASTAKDLADAVARAAAGA
jgi:L-2,4-diaminobutyrate decarboxylase